MQGKDSLLIEVNASLSESSCNFFNSLKGEFDDQYTLAIEVENSFDDIDWKYWLKRAFKYDCVYVYYYDYKLDEFFLLNIFFYKDKGKEVTKLYVLR